MKVLVYGSRGWIGGQFTNILKELGVEFHDGSARPENFRDLEKEVATIKPTHIISLIGRTHGSIDGKTYPTIDYLEQEGKLVDNIRDNLYAPMNLALLCQKLDIHLTYLGTGCIFEFDDQHPLGKVSTGFNEEDKPNFVGSSYSVVKGFTDQLMHRFEDSCLNLRVRMPIVGEDNPRNFISKITKYEHICSVPNSMSVLPELLPLVVDMMIQRTTGTINLTNPGVITHNDILEVYKELVDPEFTWKNFTIEDQDKILAARRSNNCLDTTRLQQLYPHVKHIRDSVRETLSEYKRAAVEGTPSTKESAVDLPVHILDNNDTCVLVTGGCGFIGSHFINTFFDKYQHARLINIDAMYYCASLTNVSARVRKDTRYTFVKGNICATDLISFILNTHGVTHVVHFAAQSYVQSSFTDSMQYTQDNIVGTHTLLECGRLYGKLIKFVHVSTDEVYGESMLEVGEKHKTEHSILCPTNPYAATKAGAELLAQSYCHSFGMPIVITRGNNVYGPNQYPEKVVPRFIEQLQMGKKVTIQGDGSCVRAFLHVQDTADAFMLILEKGELGEIYNIGCDQGMEYSIMGVAKMLIELVKNTKDHSKWIEYIEDRPYNDKRYYISNKKLKDLGWTIKIPFEEGVNGLLNDGF